MTARGLVVDFGGVLTTSILDSFQAFCRGEGVAWERLASLLRESYRRHDAESPVALVELGTITTDEFERRLAEALSDGTDRPVVPEGLVERMLATVEPEPAMVEAVRSVRSSGAATALLSNAWSARQYRLARVHPDELFDVVLVSTELGMRKPDPEVYREAARRLRLDPSDCVFVDDIGENVEAARAVGMRGIAHRRPDETVGALEEAFGVTIRSER